MAKSEPFSHSPAKAYWNRGEPFVWVTAAALGATLLVMATLVGVILVNGFGIFWPSNLERLTLNDGSKSMGELIKTQPSPHGDHDRHQFKIGNRDLYGLDFRWFEGNTVVERDQPADAVALERLEYGNFYGFLKEVRLERDLSGLTGDKYAMLDAAMEVTHRISEESLALGERIDALNKRIESLRLKEQALVYKGAAQEDAEVASLREEGQNLRSELQGLINQQGEVNSHLDQYYATFVDANGREARVKVHHIVRWWLPNQMGLGSKLGYYFTKLWELLSEEPREANTDGGLFPAIYGTVMLIFIMSAFSFPLGVVTAVYLREYAKEGWAVRLVRIAVNNLAGVPSIVYGVFGLGFFVYGVGGSLDALFFPERLPTPTFGTGGLLWASLTLALLTVPVVIVATEEALSSIPRGMREASLSLGATKLQTILKVALPMASPGILTGFILAMARAAGEVAPLMITGVVKLAPALPLDGEFPFLHLDRKFMHLGFHIYDVGFQSPNVEAAKPMVYVTTFLLVVIVLCMSSVAIALRNQMKKRYTLRTF